MDRETRYYCELTGAKNRAIVEAAALREKLAEAVMTLHALRETVCTPGKGDYGYDEYIEAGKLVAKHKKQTNG